MRLQMLKSLRGEALPECETSGSVRGSRLGVCLKSRLCDEAPHWVEQTIAALALRLRKSP